MGSFPEIYNDPPQNRQIFLPKKIQESYLSILQCFREDIFGGRFVCFEGEKKGGLKDFW